MLFDNPNVGRSAMQCNQSTQHENTVRVRQYEATFLARGKRGSEITCKSAVPTTGPYP